MKGSGEYRISVVRVGEQPIADGGSRMLRIRVREPRRYDWLAGDEETD